MTISRSPCSVVLEGGVTSAVVYTTLLASLSQAFTFRQLGGTSSGAVAAAAAAAAEFARGHSGKDEAFQGLAGFPGELAAQDRVGRTALFRFFQATPAGRDSLALALELLPSVDPKGSTGQLWMRALLALPVHFPTCAFLLSLVLCGLGWLCAQGWAAGVCSQLLMIDRLVGCLSLVALFLLPAAVGAWCVLAAWALWRTFRALKQHDWGLCTGMPQPGWRDSQALTPALHSLLQRLCGREPSAPRPRDVSAPPRPPLTFGELWAWPHNLPRPDDEPAGSRWIDLQVVTSAVSLARPVRLPGDVDDDPLRAFFYDPVEWQALFPGDVLAHLKSHARHVQAEIPAQGGEPARPLLALPAPAQWPVLMAIRFSLSFPILLSAVPMYIALPRKAALAQGASDGFEYRKVYFSDGGVTSNCPVHLFDAPLPRFPTFGVNLFTPSADKAPREQPNRTVVRSDELDPEVEASATDDAAAWQGPLPFLSAILTTLMDWRDSLARRQPGSRERMVHVAVPAGAGGLNLAMSPAAILEMARRGECAARQLQRDFDLDAQRRPEGSWDRHRWVRTRATLTALRQYLALFSHRLGTGAPDYLRLLQAFQPTQGGFPTANARQQALDLAQGAQALMAALDRAVPPNALDTEGPERQPALHLSPPW